MDRWKELINEVTEEIKNEGGKFRGYKRVDPECIRVFVGWHTHLSSVFVTQNMNKQDVGEVLKLSKLRKSNVLAPNEV